ncbi:hypothetical protein PDIDSM_4956 [Penicillium digitatum]|nr:hypothetical protein PDIDSM_4956 [Penicillium digitatum]
MRLTAELIQSSLTYINPLTDRELDLRGATLMIKSWIDIVFLCGRVGHKIPAIENLGIAKDQDAIDFTDNDISSLGNLPHFLASAPSSSPATNYRYWTIWRIPSVRFLDFQKVIDAERATAKELFGTCEEPSSLASKIMGVKSRTFDVSAPAERTPAEKGVRVQLTDKERKRVEQMIRGAKSLQEITKLEKELNEGRIPGGADAEGDEAMQM